MPSGLRFLQGVPQSHPGLPFPELGITAIEKPEISSHSQRDSRPYGSVLQFQCCLYVKAEPALAHPADDASEETDTLHAFMPSPHKSTQQKHPQATVYPNAQPQPSIY